MDTLIEIDLDSRFEYVNEFDDSRINDRLLRYILNSFVDLKKDVSLNIKFNYLYDKKEKDDICNMLKSSFEMALINNGREIKKLNFRNLILLFLGFLFLIIYWCLDKFNLFIFAEFFMVISWVAFWEIADSLLFKRRKLVIARRKYQKLLKAKINYL